jgi:hypothetical protein
MAVIAPSVYRFTEVKRSCFVTNLPTFNPGNRGEIIHMVAVIIMYIPGESPSVAIGCKTACNGPMARTIEFGIV